MGTIRTRRDPPPVQEIPTAEYICKIKDFKPDAVDGQYGKKDLVVFEIIDGPWKGHSCAKSFGQSLGPKARMTSLITAVGLPPVPDGQSFDFSLLLNRTLVVGVKANRNDEGRVFNNAETWRPYFPNAVPPPVVPPVQPVYPSAPPEVPQPAAYPPGYVPQQPTVGPNYPPATGGSAPAPVQPAPSPTAPGAVHGGSVSGRPNF